MATKEIKFESTTDLKMTGPWQKFFNKFKDIEEEPFKSKVFLWKDVHMLAYICKRYESLYGKKFAVTIKNAPTKCPEMFFVSKMIRTLGTSNMVTVKAYVDWVYDTKIIPDNKKIRTLSYFMTPGFCNEFSFEQTENEIIKRSSILPKSFKDIADSLNVSVSTYGDLAFIKMAAERATDLNNPNVQFIKNIQALGFELSILEKLAE
jgi:hypothetical protein